MHMTLATTMIKTQLETNNILDARLCAAFETVKREDFAPAAFAGACYVDAAIPVSATRAMSEPLTLGRILSLADIHADEAVLVVGDATGYTASILAELTQNVTVLEEESAIADSIRKNCCTRTNITVIEAPWASKPAQKINADVIIIEGGIEAVPAWLSGALRAGGRILYIEHKTTRPDSGSGLGVLTKLVKNDTVLAKTSYEDVFIQKLSSFNKPLGFIF